LVIEDIDSMPEGLRSQFLNQLDGTHDNEGVFVIGTTNYPERIDPALMNRAGRFDRVYEINPPDADMRYRYLLKKGIDQILDDETIRYVADRMDGFSMATLNELYTSVVLQHCYDGLVDVDSIIDSLKKVSEKQEKDTWFETNKRTMGFEVR
jgi:SpoVK/Ycf46/Vps4 family AAA+-type ATPase